ncbi:terminase large subunit [Dubosiella newyorkensis]|uniref:terminase large subunit n=1 Tax=Dubosiella newyorkensis TaxID=1862672 RepID=UPI00272E1900|nr:terminase large subunit [Dubosiella newyorkensis]
MRTRLKGKFGQEVLSYATGCISGKIKANHYRVRACARFLKDLENPDYEFRPHDADFVIKLIEKRICHMKGEMQDGTPLRGKPFKLMKWHKFVVYNLLGFWHKGTKLRRFKEALIFVPRKSAKTSFAASLAWALGVLNRASGSTIYIVAAALKQSMQSFDFIEYNIKNMGEWDKEGGCFNIVNNNQEHVISGEMEDDGSLRIEALAANPDAQDSFGCNVAIADEIHAFKKPKQYNLFNEAMKSFSNKLMIGISTAGDDPNGFLANRVKYCKKVLDDQIKDEQYFIFICEADFNVNEAGEKYLDYLNPDILEAANPSVGESVRLEELIEDANQAYHDPQQRKDFFAKSLNIFTDPINTYFDMNMVRTSDQKYNWTLEELASMPIKWYGAADLSKMHDLTGAGLYGTYRGVDIFISHAFCPILEANRKADEDNVPTHFWKEMGWLTLCNGPIIEFEDVVKWFISMQNLGFKIRWIGYDRRYAREFVLKMKKAGFKMRDQSQRYVEKTEAFREIEKQIRRHNFYYLHSEAFDYCISNVKAIEDSDEFVRFEKVLPNLRIDLFDCAVIGCKQKLIASEKSASASAFLE